MKKVRKNITGISIVAFCLGLLYAGILSLVLLLIIYRMSGAISVLEGILIIALYMIILNWITKKGIRNIFKCELAIINIKELGKYSDGELNCSFCGRTKKNVKKLIAGPCVYICAECIGLCSQIIFEEYGENKNIKEKKNEKEIR